MYFFHSIIMRIGLIMAKCGVFLACIKKYTQQLYLSHVLTSYLHCFPCSDSHVPPRSQGSGADRRCGRDRCHSGGFLLRIMPPSWHPVHACIPHDYAAGGLFFCAGDNPCSDCQVYPMKSGIAAAMGLFPCIPCSDCQIDPLKSGIAAH